MADSTEALTRGLNNNNEEFSLYDRFRHFLGACLYPVPTLKAVVGYFRSSGYFPLRESLKSLKTIQVSIALVWRYQESAA